MEVASKEKKGRTVAIVESAPAIPVMRAAAPFVLPSLASLGHSPFNDSGSPDQRPGSAAVAEQLGAAEVAKRTAVVDDVAAHLAAASASHRAIGAAALPQLLALQEALQRASHDAVLNDASRHLAAAVLAVQAAPGGQGSAEDAVAVQRQLAEASAAAERAAPRSPQRAAPPPAVSMRTAMMPGSLTAALDMADAMRRQREAGEDQSRRRMARRHRRRTPSSSSSDLDKYL